MWWGTWAGPGSVCNTTNCPDLATCATDMNGDFMVGFEELLDVLGNWGPCERGAPCLADMNQSGAVDFEDLLMVLTDWGSCTG